MVYGAVVQPSQTSHHEKPTEYSNDAVYQITNIFQTIVTKISSLDIVDERSPPSQTSVETNYKSYSGSHIVTDCEGDII